MSRSIAEITETALVLLVPEVEDLVGAYRRQFDPSAELGVPAHITINYPFLPGVDRTLATLEDLENLFARFDPFEFTLARLARWRDVLYLASGPEEPFRNLIDAVEGRYRDSPPYGGEYSDVIPHLTIAYTQDERILTWLETRLAGLLHGVLPLAARAEEVWLLENAGQRWESVASFRLGFKD